MDEIDDRLFQCEVITVQIEAHRDAMRRLAGERAWLLATIRADGYGLGQLGKRLGLSKTRMQQLVKVGVT